MTKEPSRNRRKTMGQVVGAGVFVAFSLLAIVLAAVGKPEWYDAFIDWLRTLEPQ